jgi:hypothetical protein
MADRERLLVAGARSLVWHIENGQAHVWTIRQLEATDQHESTVELAPGPAASSVADLARSSSDTGRLESGLHAETANRSEDTRMIPLSGSDHRSSVLTMSLITRVKVFCPRMTAYWSDIERTIRWLRKPSQALGSRDVLPCFRTDLCARTSLSSNYPS